MTDDLKVLPAKVLTADAEGTVRRAHHLPKRPLMVAVSSVDDTPKEPEKGEEWKPKLSIVFDLDHFDDTEIVGTLRDRDTDEPVPNAELSIEFLVVPNG